MGKRYTVWRLGLEAMILDFGFVEEKAAEAVARLVEIARDEALTGGGPLRVG